MPKIFPMKYSAFLEGDFTANYAVNSRSGSQPFHRTYAKKRLFIDSLYDIHCLNDHREYSLYHKFSNSATEGDEICVSQLVNYTTKRRNVINVCKISQLDSKLMKKLQIFYLDLIPIVENVYAEFRKSRL